MAAEYVGLAADVYEARRSTPSLPRRAARAVVVFIVNLLSMGSGPANPGGASVVVVERATGREVWSATEEMGDDGQGTVSSKRADLASMSADDFTAKWL